MNIKNISMEKLSIPNYNPRKKLAPGDTEYEKLKKSIETFGYVEPIVYNEKTGNVVGGNQRLQVLIDIGQKTVECVVVNLTEKEEKILNVALNKISGEWDDAKLEDLLRELKLTNSEIALTGFSTGELNEILYSNANFDIDETDAEMPETNENIITKSGDLWMLGNHRLFCGDCTDASALDELFLNGKKADLLLTDPPYGVFYTGTRKKRKRIQNDDLQKTSLIIF